MPLLSSFIEKRTHTHKKKHWKSFIQNKNVTEMLTYFCIVSICIPICNISRKVEMKESWTQLSFQFSKITCAQGNICLIIMSKSVCWWGYSRKFLSMLLWIICSLNHTVCSWNMDWTNWVFSVCIMTFCDYLEEIFLSFS